MKGTFRVREKIRVVALILDEQNYARFRDGAEFTSVNSTGRVPSGTIGRRLEAGTYFLVFDNSQGTGPVIMDANFVVE